MAFDVSVELVEEVLIELWRGWEIVEFEDGGVVLIALALHY